MKNIILKSIQILITLTAILAVSCSAEDGTDGVMGIPGIQGEQGLPGTNGEDGINGTNGINGEDGTDGEDGNANVIISDWVEPTDDSYTLNNARVKSLELADRVSAEVRLEGAFLVYYDNDIEISLLPKSSFFSGAVTKTVETRINHATRSLTISINKYNSDITAREYLWDPNGAPYSKGVRFRYVFIPGETSSKKDSPNFKKMSYESVMNYFDRAL